MSRRYGGSSAWNLLWVHLIEAIMHSSGDFLGTPNLDYEAWQHVVRSICGRYTPEGIEPKAFSGRARLRSIFGFRAVELSSNAYRLERTRQDIRGDAADHYYALFQMAGQSRIIQNDRIMELTVGDVALVDAARPVTYLSQKGSSTGDLCNCSAGRWLLIWAWNRGAPLRVAGRLQRAHYVN